MDERKPHRDNVPAARRLRSEATPTEVALWTILRDRRLSGWKFRRQHPVGAFVLDFYCAAAMLAVEIDGHVHDEPEQQARDSSRQRILEAGGIRFLRLPAGIVERRPDEAVERILEALSSRMAANR